MNITPSPTLSFRPSASTCGVAGDLGPVPLAVVMSITSPTGHPDIESNPEVTISAFPVGV